MTVEITISGNSLTKLRKLSNFSTCCNFQQQFIDDETMKRMVQLTRLDVESLTNRSLSHLTNLKWLYVHMNSDITLDYIIKLTNLTTLCFSGENLII